MGWKLALLALVLIGIGVTSMGSAITGSNWNAPSQGTNAGYIAFWGGLGLVVVGVGVFIYGLFT